MKHSVAVGGLAVLLITGFSAAASPVFATAKPGASCTKAGQTSVVSGRKFTCIKSSRKLVWNRGNLVSKNSPTLGSTPNPFTSAASKAEAARKAADKKCMAGISCKVGNKGPGGGIVFYDAGSTQAWGRYLEISPARWSGSDIDPQSKWCNVDKILLTDAVSDPTLKATLGTTIGTGKADTNLMLASCSSGASSIVHAYRGGGKADWFLPSKDELAAFFDEWLSPNSRIIVKMGMVGDDYWSSSQRSSLDVWTQGLIYNQESAFTILSEYIRPIRAF